MRQTFLELLISGLLDGDVGFFTFSSCLVFNHHLLSLVEDGSMSMSHGEGGGRSGVTLRPLSSRVVRSENESEDGDEQENGDRNNCEGCSPCGVLGQAVAQETVV